MGYRHNVFPANLRIYLGYDYSSGDKNLSDNNLETFNPLFPLAHAYFGYIDIGGRQNVVDLSQGFSLWPIEKKLFVKIDYHMFERAQNTDAFYNAGGGMVRAGDSDGRRNIGSEIDLTLKYIFDAQTTLWFGYSHFSPDDFIEGFGLDEEINFAYSTLHYTF